MYSLCYVIVGAVLVALTTAQYDSEFCRKYLDRVDDSSATGLKPDFYDNFYVFMEIKDIIKRSTLYVDEYYSKQAGMVYGTVRGQVNQSQIWVDANTNEILIGPTTKSVCQDAPLADSTIAVALGATTDASGDVTLNTPEGLSPPLTTGYSSGLYPPSTTGYSSGLYSPSTTGYSGGVIVGIAFGMLFLGILLSVGAVFAFYRFRIARGSTSVQMKILDEESET